jgi:hypothetical protein
MMQYTEKYAIISHQAGTRGAGKARARNHNIDRLYATPTVNGGGHAIIRDALIHSL